MLGLAVARRLDGGGFTLRMDSYAERFFVSPGAADDVSVIGWEVRDAPALTEVARRVEAAGSEVIRASPAETALRGVEGLVKFRDPAGIPSELFYGAGKAPAPFSSGVLVSGFLAEERGLGHVVVSSQNKQESTDFYERALGFRLSDHIECQYFGFDVDLSFYHANSRHHSVAIGGPQKKSIHHFMIEVTAMDDVGLCFDRALASGVPIMQTLGRHPNDRMFSFYAKTPSGFQFEFGWGGRDVDDATWQPTRYNQISEWGHHPPMVFSTPPKRTP